MPQIAVEMKQVDVERMGQEESGVKWNGYDTDNENVTKQNTSESQQAGTVAVRGSSQVSRDHQADTVAVRASSQVSRDQQAEQVHQVVYECENCCGFESTCVAFVEDHETRCMFGRDGGKRQQIEHSEAEQQVHRLRKRFKINQSAAMACFEAGAASALPSTGVSTTARPRQMQKLREAAIQEAAIKVFRRNARAFCCDQVTHAHGSCAAAEYILACRSGLTLSAETWSRQYDV